VVGGLFLICLSLIGFAAALVRGDAARMTWGGAAMGLWCLAELVGVGLVSRLPEVQSGTVGGTSCTPESPENTKSS
jgi:hypothetical protein